MSYKKKAGTHDENRGKVCLICLKKESRCNNKFKKIYSKGKIEGMVNSIFKYSAYDEHLPNALCTACYRNLYRAKDGTRNTIELPDLSQFNRMKYSTGTPSQLSCQCKICNMVREPLIKIETEEVNASTFRKSIKST